MKKLISLLLTLVMALALLPAAHAAEDEATEAAQALYELGLFKGTGTNPDGTPIFDLDKTPTRNQAIIMLVRLLGKEEEALAGKWDIPFTDVTEAMRPYIGYAYCNGLTNGTSATTYSGTNPIKPNQYITFVLRALGYTSGEDFQVPTAWGFSDEIGLTDGAYSAATTKFTRGDVAKISCSALSTCLQGSQKTLLEQLLEDKAAGPDSFEAWYEVDEKGRLTVKTDYTIFRKEGYWTLIDLTFRDGSHSHDSQGGYFVPAEYDVTSLLSFWEEDVTVSSIKISLYKDASQREAFWKVWEEKNSKERALAAFEDQLVMRFVINESIAVEQAKEPFSLTALSIERNEDKQQETYTAQISAPITDMGEYGLVYEGRTGGQNRGLSYIGRGDGYLTFTREINHFAEEGAAGTFYITHNSYARRDDGTLVCTVTRSSGVEYAF